jgi:hypothetical protein
VQFVQDDQRSGLGPGELADDFAVFGDVPVEVLAATVEQRSGESRLAALPGTGQQNHFPLQIFAQARGEIPHMATKNIIISVETKMK